MPTLEQYSYLLGLPIIDRVTFTNLEGEFEVEANMTTKGRNQRFTCSVSIGDSSLLFQDKEYNCF